MRKYFAIAAGLVLAAGMALAQQGGQSMKMDMKNMPNMEKKGTSHPITGTGTVKVVDAKTHKLNLAHDPIPAIKWPAMQMDFQVAPDVDLSALKVGQAVEFTLTPTSSGSYSISSVKPKG